MTEQVENPTTMGKIEMVDLKKQYARLRPEIDARMQNVLLNTTFINGPEVAEFAKMLADYLGTKHVIPCANGTDALQLVLMAYGFAPGAEVLVPSFNYVATAETVAMMGLVPVWIDVHYETYNLEPSELQRKLTNKTVAIMAVHLFGQGADMQAVLSFANAHGLVVIEDNAQAIGCDITIAGRTKKAGTWGHVGTTSFFPSKNLGCMGDGGAIYTDDDALATKMRMYANHGQKQKYEYELIGINSRLDTLQAAVLLAKLPHLDDFISRRQAVAAYYDAELGKVEGITIPSRVQGSTHVYHQYTLKVAGGKRNALKAGLEAKGVPTMIYYPKVLHLQQAFLPNGMQSEVLAVSEKLSAEVLSLPMHTEMTAEQMAYIVASVKEAMQ